MKKIISKTIAMLIFTTLTVTVVFSQSLNKIQTLDLQTSTQELQELEKENDFQQPFTLNPVTDGIIGGLSLSLAGSAVLCDKVFHIKPNNTGDYKPFPLNKEDVNGFDRPFMQNYSKTLDYVGDGVLATTFLLPALMFTNSNTDWLTVGIMYAETLALTYGVKQWSKMIITRPRPYMYFDDYPQGEVDRGDWHCSMPSGHTTMAFSAAAFTSAVFNEYFPDSFWRHIVTAGSFGLATTVGIVRMCSGNHFCTDVLTGAAIGTLCGFVVPFFHSQTFDNLIGKNKNTEVSVSPMGFNVLIRLN